MFIKILLIVLLLLPYLISTEPIALTDQTWGDMLKGQWMVEFYAPWCPACKQFTSIWNDFSKAMAPKNVKVAAIDVQQYPSLSGRFGISALPTVYHVNDGVIRQYHGQRSLNSLKKYIENQEWQRTEPASKYFGPNSILMSITSSLFEVSLIVKNAHALLQDYYGWPSWVIYTIFAVGVLCLGILLGFGCLQIFDYCLGSFSKDDTNTVPEDIDELDEDDNQQLIYTTDENRDIEVIQSYSSDEAEEEEEQQQTPTDQTVRQRRLNE